ncbi:DUF1285 domain-containing protein [Acetobacter ascendens]|nr:DUF1285 domain-containing protein [Acetobacter ascendens]AOW50095.1 hypothetical protein A4R89_12505 [Acetobacter ascendens]ARW09364.1 hypothetical protein S101447_00258 [Acetobacter ascendens]RCL09823.1 hypothetical protein BBA71_00310 [Acetobacter pasteurianus]GCD74626.1 hypothetical protein NBRC3299_0918 [Acetobacter pasteurianus NBRC 3299]
MKGEHAVSGDSLACSGHQESPERKRHDLGYLPFLVRRDGVWLYRGTPIKRKAMLCMFGSMLTRDEKGAYLLRSPFETGYIEVEDVPFLAVELDWTGCGRMQRLCFRTNMDEVVVAGPEHPIRTDWNMPPEACPDSCPPYIRLREGDDRHFPLEARLSRPVWYELAALAEPGMCQGIPCMGVWSCGCFFPLARQTSGTDCDV